MGKIIGDSVPKDGMRDAAVKHFFTAASWIEGAATQQLLEVACLPDMISVAGFPDLHPGKYGPVGMAALSERLYPQLIGNDIGCGMSFFELDLPLRKFKIEKAAEQLRKMEEIGLEDPADRLVERDMGPDFFRQWLGTIGGGNHFCEVQAVDEILGSDGEGVVDRQKLFLLVHSGSRALGAEIFRQALEENGSMAGGIDAGTHAAVDWLLGHNLAVEWASLNRQMIAERAAAALRADVRLIADIPHNLVRITGQGFVHYKGAAAVGDGIIAPVAGSRATLSHLVKTLAGAEASHWGISHGAGRKYDRKTMHGRVGANRTQRDALRTNDWGGVAICDDRNLLIEEASTAYKDAGKVVSELQAFGLVEPLATLKPLVTYKTVEPERMQRENGRGRDRTTIRRNAQWMK
jgi:release factor H-coupled RctB family protein